VALIALVNGNARNQSDRDWQPFAFEKGILGFAVSVFHRVDADRELGSESADGGAHGFDVRTVRDDRSLLPRMVSTAMATISP
jgi:hypothetical protein